MSYLRVAYAKLNSFSLVLLCGCVSYATNLELVLWLFCKAFTMSHAQMVMLAMILSFSLINTNDCLVSFGQARSHIQLSISILQSADSKAVISQRDMGHCIHLLLNSISYEQFVHFSHIESMCIYIFQTQPCSNFNQSCRVLFKCILFN